MELTLHIVLKELRKTHKYSRDYLAKYMNISVQAYGHWETGIRKPSIEDLIKLADLYGVSLDYLVGRYK